MHVAGLVQLEEQDTNQLTFSLGMRRHFFKLLDLGLGL